MTLNPAGKGYGGRSRLPDNLKQLFRRVAAIGGRQWCDGAEACGAACKRGYVRKLAHMHQPSARRPIAMSAPDQELIAQVLLCSEGFTHAAPLARKLVALLALAAGGCSAQQHYDWGLRALKTALGAAGRLLREVQPGLSATALGHFPRLSCAHAKRPLAFTE